MAGSRVAAFFDVDHTLLSADTGLRFALHQFRRGHVSAVDLIRVSGWMLRHRLHPVDQESLIARVAAVYAGTPVAQAEAEMRRWFEAEMVRFVRPAGRARVAEHLAAGHVVALLSSGTRYTLQPLADLLGIGHVLGTVFEEAEGRLTGRHERPACAGSGKVVHAERFAERHGIDLATSFFYTDSLADRALLERVGEPRAVTPDRRLRRLAKRQGWPIEDWATA